MRLPFAISLTFALSVLAACPATGHVPDAVMTAETMEPNISVSVKASVLHVKGAEGQTLYIYNVTGILVKCLKIDGSDRRYDVNLPQGCYIVKVGKWVRKISVR